MGRSAGRGSEASARAAKQQKTSAQQVASSAVSGPAASLRSAAVAASKQRKAHVALFPAAAEEEERAGAEQAGSGGAGAGEDAGYFEEESDMEQEAGGEAGTACGQVDSLRACQCDLGTNKALHARKLATLCQGVAPVVATVQGGSFVCTGCPSQPEMEHFEDIDAHFVEVHQGCPAVIQAGNKVTHRLLPQRAASPSGCWRGATAPAATVSQAASAGTAPVQPAGAHAAAAAAVAPVVAVAAPGTVASAPAATGAPAAMFAQPLLAIGPAPPAQATPQTAPQPAPSVGGAPDPAPTEACAALGSAAAAAAAPAAFAAAPAAPAASAAAAAAPPPLQATGQARDASAALDAQCECAGAYPGCRRLRRLAAPIFLGRALADWDDVIARTYGAAAVVRAHRWVDSQAYVCQAAGCSAVLGTEAVAEAHFLQDHPGERCVLQEADCVVGQLMEECPATMFEPHAAADVSAVNALLRHHFVQNTSVLMRRVELAEQRVGGRLQALEGHVGELLEAVRAVIRPADDGEAEDEDE